MDDQVEMIDISTLRLSCKPGLFVLCTDVMMHR